jgi:hypothetical protein
MNASVFAGSLDNPRGLKFGPDGNLYVAEAGTGGTESTAGMCVQIPGPIGPYSGSMTGSRISAILPDGRRMTMAGGLPSSMTAQPGAFVSGVADVAFVGNALFAILAGAGCSHGVSGMPNAVISVAPDGTWRQLVDLGAFLRANPTRNPDPQDDESDGTWYSMAAVDGALYAVEPNHGELDRITTDGRISRLVDISETQGHIVPTALTIGPDGCFYIGNLGKFPASPRCKVLRITRSAGVSVVAEGLTTVLGTAFDSRGRLFALETSAPATSSGPPTLPGTGRVVLIRNDGSLQPVVTGLTFPTAMTFGPDGMLYISNFGFGFPPGKGEVLRVEV